MHAITNTSPLLYLHRVGGLEWLPSIFENVVTTQAVLNELSDGAIQGYDVPDVKSLGWLSIECPRNTVSEWLSVDLGLGELSVLTLALDNPLHIVILDDFGDDYGSRSPPVLLLSPVANCGDRRENVCI